MKKITEKVVLILRKRKMRAAFSFTDGVFVPVFVCLQDLRIMEFGTEL